MIYSVRHITRYTYAKQVFLEPHTIRLLPRPDPSQQALEHILRIEPEPGGRAFGLDLWGNGFLQVWFNGLHKELRIESTCRLQTLRENPFDYFLPPCGQTLPMQYSAVEQEGLQSCLMRRYPFGQEQRGASGTVPDRHRDDVAELAAMLRRQTQQSSTGFLSALNTWLFTHVQRSERLEPGVLHPQALLFKRVGSCRDLAVLFVETCREAGIPARFASGYQEGDPDTPEAELHAWAEVYLPGIGWRGYDPTHGLVVADRHIVLAAAPEPEQTMPVAGNYRGTGVSSHISHEVWMIPLAEKRISC
ncbi:MAG: transglutaminase family protein [Desulfovibrionales bacterium]|nr:MAG: transglutaminase family protein [Desulfovibrionales bacterium]